MAYPIYSFGDQDSLGPAILNPASIATPAATLPSFNNGFGSTPGAVPFEDAPDDSQLLPAGPKRRVGLGDVRASEGRDSAPNSPKTFTSGVGLGDVRASEGQDSSAQNSLYGFGNSRYEMPGQGASYSINGESIAAPTGDYGVSAAPEDDVSAERRLSIRRAQSTADQQRQSRESSLAKARMAQKQLDQSESMLREERATLPKGVDLWQMRQLAKSGNDQLGALGSALQRQRDGQALTRDDRKAILAYQSAQDTVGKADKLDAALEDIPNQRKDIQSQVAGIGSEALVPSGREIEAGMQSKFKRQDAAAAERESDKQMARDQKRYTNLKSQLADADRALKGYEKGGKDYKEIEGQVADDLYVKGKRPDLDRIDAETAKRVEAAKKKAGGDRREGIRARMQTFEQKWGDDLNPSGGTPASMSAASIQPGSDEEFQLFKSRYPDKSDEEIRAAMNELD